MKQIGTVFLFTLRDAAKKKSFLISSIIMLLVILVLCALPKIISNFSADNEPSSPEESGISSPAEDSQRIYTCYFADEAALLENACQTLSLYFPDTRFEEISAAEIEQYSTLIKDDETLSLISVTPDENNLPVLTITCKDFMSGINAQTAAQALSDLYIANTLAKQGISSDTIAFAQSSLPFSVTYMGTMNVSGYAIGILLTMLIFFAIYFYGYGVSMSVATEKTSRVMETLVVSAKPSRILIGKCLAMGVLGLAQFTGVLLFGVLCYKLFIPAGFTLMGMELSLSAFTLKSALLIALYFILGYSLYAVMNAVCGASVSKIEDLNSAMMPVMMISLISFYLAYFSAITTSGEGILQKAAMYIPFCSPFIMPFKLLNGNVATVDLIISIALLILFILLIAAVSIRIYTASVLHYGKRMKLKDLYKTKV
jgi:hypothetical protein